MVGHDKKKRKKLEISTSRDRGSPGNQTGYNSSQRHYSKLLRDSKAVRHAHRLACSKDYQRPVASSFWGLDQTLARGQSGALWIFLVGWLPTSFFDAAISFGGATDGLAIGWEALFFLLASLSEPLVHPQVGWADDQ